jgi:aminoglycoside 3-N-acetyltransferase I
MQNFSILNQNHLQNLLNKPDFMVFVVLLENKVIGGLTAYVLTSYYVESSDVYILDLAIKTEFQRKGLGKKLMEMIIEHCKEQNMNEIFVQADEIDQHAVNFYHSLGGIPEKAINFDYPLAQTNKQKT